MQRTTSFPLRHDASHRAAQCHARMVVPREASTIVDHGAPRTELATVPEGEEVKSVNAASREVLRPHQDKPTLGDAAHNGAVLKHIADSSGQPVFSIAFDFEYYCNPLQVQFITS